MFPNVFNKKTPPSMVSMLKLTTKIHAHISQSVTLLLLFERGFILLHLSSSDVTWFCMAAVMPVYKAAM